MSFVQLIEFKSSHPYELNDLISRWMTETKGTRTTTHAMVKSDRENPGTYVEIIEFPSYESAMKTPTRLRSDKQVRQPDEVFVRRTAGVSQPRGDARRQVVKKLQLPELSNGEERSIPPGDDFISLSPRNESRATVNLRLHRHRPGH
jgi:hypothetical protein